MKTEAAPNTNPPTARDIDDLLDTLFRTLRDLRTGRITVQEAVRL